ncbi:hypothetical protein OKW38_005009 [Paraburkholderia sp. MM5496-R1]
MAGVAVALLPMMTAVAIEHSTLCCVAASMQYQFNVAVTKGLETRHGPQFSSASRVCQSTSD